MENKFKKQYKACHSPVVVSFCALCINSRNCIYPLELKIRAHRYYNTYISVHKLLFLSFIYIFDDIHILYPVSELFNAFNRASFHLPSPCCRLRLWYIHLELRLGSVDSLALLVTSHVFVRHTQNLPQQGDYRFCRPHLTCVISVLQSVSSDFGPISPNCNPFYNGIRVQ